MVATNTADSGGGKTLPLSHRKRSGSEVRQKGRRITFRLTADEYQTVEDAARGDGVTVGTYIRERTLSAPKMARRRRPQADVAALSAAHRQVRAVGGNLNQIARSLNIGEMQAAGELPTVLAELQKTLVLVRQAMGFEE